MLFEIWKGIGNLNYKMGNEMPSDLPVPDDPLDFIKGCVSEKRIFWTYHVNMRMKGRFIPRQIVLESINHYEIIEEYPGDKYLPSYLIFSKYRGKIFHVLFAVDVEEKNVRVITAYYPSPDEWEEGFKIRRKSL